MLFISVMTRVIISVAVRKFSLCFFPQHNNCSFLKPSQDAGAVAYQFDPVGEEEIPEGAAEEAETREEVSKYATYRKVYCCFGV